MILERGVSLRIPEHGVSLWILELKKEAGASFFTCFCFYTEGWVQRRLLFDLFSLHLMVGRDKGIHKKCSI